MTDNADKVHPIIEAMARAIAEACGEPQAWVAHIEPAKAAAKVLLTTRPSPRGILAGLQAQIDDTDLTVDEVAAIYKAMTAAARSEMGV